MVKIAINTNHKNKMPTDIYGHELRNWWNKFNGDFNNYKVPVEVLIEQIRKGYSYTTQHRRYRKADNFICGQHIGLDFDTGDDRSSIKSLLNTPFIQDNASFLHATASHNNLKPRSRAVFILERPIYSKSKYSLLTEAFTETFSTSGGADQSCKDPVRIFFGAENCQVVNIGNILTFQAAKEIVEPYKDKLQKLRETVRNTNHGTAISDGGFVLNNLVNIILDAPNGQKYNTLIRVSRTAGGYVAGGYFTEQYAYDILFQAIASRPSTRDLHIAKNSIEWGLRTGRTEPLYLEEDKDPLIQGLFA